MIKFSNLEVHTVVVLNLDTKFSTKFSTHTGVCTHTPVPTKFSTTCIVVYTVVVFYKFR